MSQQLALDALSRIWIKLAQAGLFAEREALKGHIAALEATQIAIAQTGTDLGRYALVAFASHWRQADEEEKRLNILNALDLLLAPHYDEEQAP